MKKIFCLSILLILFSTILFACNSGRSRDGKKEKDLDLSEIVLAYKVTNFAWGEINYAYIIDGYGHVKKVDLVSKKFYGDELISYLEECMKNDEIQSIINIGEIPEEIVNRIKRISNIKLEAVNSDEKIDMGTFDYYCASGEESEGIFLIQTLGDSVYKSKDKDIIEVCKYIDDIMKKIE